MTLSGYFTLKSVFGQQSCRALTFALARLSCYYYYMVLYCEVVSEDVAETVLNLLMKSDDSEHWKLSATFDPRPLTLDSLDLEVVSHQTETFQTK